MRRFLLASFLLMSLAAAAVAASVTVTHPAANETWNKGQAHTITWTKTGDMPATVRIVLRNKANTAAVQTIAEPAPNSGSYSWTIPASVAEGEYRIRVRVLSSEISDDSEIFTVAPASQPPAASITVTKPVDGDNWVSGTKHVIQWTTTGSTANPVSIALVKPDGSPSGQTLVYTMPNLPPYEWTIQDYIPYGEYRVRVQVLQSQIHGDSGKFSVIRMAQALKPGVKMKLDPIITRPAVEIRSPMHVIGNGAGFPSSSFFGRPNGYPAGAAPFQYAMVGYDRYSVPHPNAGTPVWFTNAHRSGFKFALDDLRGRGDRLKSAKIRFKQVGSLISGVTNASCGMRMFKLLVPVGYNDFDPQKSSECGLIFTSPDYTVDVKDTVRGWLNEVMPNYGFFVVSPEVDYGTQAQVCISSFEITLTLEFF